MASNKNTKRHRYIGITLVILNCVTFLIAIAVMTLGVPAPGTVTITSPGPSTLIESSNFTVTGTATPNKQIQVYLNNAFVGQTASDGNGDWSVDVTGVKNGQINLYAKITEDPFMYVAHTGGAKTFSQIDTATNALVSTIPSGIKQPKQLLHHPSQPRLYVSSYETATIKVINSSTMETITDIADTSADKIVLSPSGDKLYALKAGASGYIKKFNTSTNALENSTGTNIYDVDITPDGSTLYGVNNSSSIISWGTSDLAQLSTIAISSSALRISVSNDGTKAYASEMSAEQIEVIDLGLEIVTNTIAMDAQPSDITISPTGGIAVVGTSGSESKMKILNLTSETITGDLSTDLSEGKLVFNDSGSLAYWGNGSVKVIDIGTNSTIATIGKNGYGGLALNTDGSKLFAGDFVSGHDIHVIDADTAPYNFIETKEYPQLEYFVELTNDGTKAYASSNSTGKIFIINTVTNTIEGSIDSDQLFNCDPAQTVLNNNETKLYVASSNCPVVFVIDTATNQFLSYIDITSASNFIQFDSTGTKLYIARGTDVLIYNTTSDTITDTISIGSGLAYAMALTADDNKLYVADPVGNRIVVINTITKAVATTITTASGVYTVAINPAGTVGYGSMPFTNQYIKFSTVSDTAIGSPITTDTYPTSINFLPDGNTMYVVTINGLVDVFNPATDTKSSTITIPSGAFILNSGLLRNRVINTATQNIFINAPELGELLTVPTGYTPLVAQSGSAAANLSLAPITPSENGTAVSESSSGVSSSQSGDQNLSNFFGDIPNTIIEAIKSTPASVARVFPWILFTLLMAVAGMLMLQVFLEYRNIKQNIILADKERSLRAEKKNFLALSAHYLRTPLSIIQGGLELINYKSKKHEADGALNITKILGGEIEHVLQKLHDEEVPKPNLKADQFQNIGIHVLASPTFLIPAILVGVISISANILFINVARLDLGVINLITQAMFFIAAVTVFYFVVRTFIASRARQKATRTLLEEEDALSQARNKLITDTHHVLSQELQHLSASLGVIKVKNQKPLLNVANGIKSFEDTLAKFELAADLEAGSTHFNKDEQVNISKVINQITKDYSSELKSKNLRIKAQVPSFGNVTTNSKSLHYVLGTLMDNATKFSPKKSIISISGNRTSLGYKLTITDSGPGINKGQLKQLFKPFSRVDNAMVFEKQGMGLSLYLDRLIMQALGGKIAVDSTAGKGTKVTLLIA